MSIRRRMILYSVVTSLFLVVLVLGLFLYHFRDQSLANERQQSLVTAEMSELLIDERMKNGQTTGCSTLLQQLQRMTRLDALWILPSPSTLKEYPQANNKRPLNPLELNAINQRAPVESLDESLNQVKYHFAFPFMVHRDSKLSCLQCHHVDEGEPLGVLSLSIDLTDQRTALLEKSWFIVAVIFSAGFLLSGFFISMIMPLLRSAREIGNLVEKAVQGDFTSRLREDGCLEVRSISRNTNRLLQSMEQCLNKIVTRIESLTPHTSLPPDGTLLNKALGIVDNLADAVNFKQAIEDDYDLSEVYKRLVITLRDKFDIRHFSIFETNDDRQRLRLVHAENPPESQEIWCNPQILENGQLCRALRTGSMVNGLQNPGLCMAFNGESHCRHVCLPVIEQGMLGGVWQIVFTENEIKSAAHKLPRLQSLLSEAMPVIESKRLLQTLKDNMMKDPMTGLFNRRFLEDFMMNITSNADRRNKPIGILACDVDHFKQVNDTYGHDVGDHVLVEVAKILKSVARQSDLVFRLGGEEFMMLLIDVDADHVMEVAERVKRAIEEHKFSCPDGILYKTVSIGVAIYPIHGTTFEACMKAADTALYEAKNTGRNRICTCTI